MLPARFICGSVLLALFFFTAFAAISSEDRSTNDPFSRTFDSISSKDNHTKRLLDDRFSRDLAEVHTCEIAMMATDYFTKEPVHETACFDIQDGRFHDLIPPAMSKSDDQVRPVTGDIVHLRAIRTPVLDSNGVQNGDGSSKLQVLSWSKVEGSETIGGGRRRLQQPPNNGGAETRTVVAIIIRFTDSTSPTGLLGTDMDNPEKRKSYARILRSTLFGDGTGSPNHVDAWNQCSYGKMTLKIDSDGLNASGIPGQYAADFPADPADIYYADVPRICSMTADPKCYQNYDVASVCASRTTLGMGLYALSQLEQTVPGFSRANYQHRVLVFDQSNTNCSFVGLGNIGCSSTFCFSWIPNRFSSRLSSYLHEMGHTLSLSHAGSGLYSSGLDREYRDYSDAMGYCCYTRCYNGPHSYQLGWLPAIELTSMNITTGTSYVLNSMSTTASNSLISIRADWPGGDNNTYWIQMKTPNGYDQYGSDTVFNNVQIKQWNKESFRITLDQGVRLFTGGSWLDPSKKVFVQVQNILLLAESGAFATINIGWATGNVVVPTTVPTAIRTIAPIPIPTVLPTPLPTTTPSTIAPTLTPTIAPTSLAPTTYSPTLITTTTGPSTAVPSIAAQVIPITIAPTTTTQIMGRRRRQRIPTIAPSFRPTFKRQLCRMPCIDKSGNQGISMYRNSSSVDMCRSNCFQNVTQGRKQGFKCGTCRF